MRTVIAMWPYFVLALLALAAAVVVDDPNVPSSPAAPSVDQTGPMGATCPSDGGTWRS
ncbi:MAG: hypothetical protein R2705_14910 [Ilumatobacteraceae bacterium]